MQKELSVMVSEAHFIMQNSPEYTCMSSDIMRTGMAATLF